MRKLLLALVAMLAIAHGSLRAQTYLPPTDGSGNWLVKCTVISVDSPPIGPCNGAFTAAALVTATPAGWATVPIVGPGSNSYSYISEQANASIWAASPNENPHYEYTFRTTFNVAPADVSDALFLDVFWLDNYWGGWSINGSAFSASGISPVPLPPNGTNWQAPFTLSIPGGNFVSGTNTLELRIEGNGITDGILVRGSYAGVGNPESVVPEPATMTLLATGLVGLVATRRRRRKAA